MGINSLAKFVNQRFKGWKTSQIKGKLIVDGYALFRALSDYGTGQSEMYGGDYVSVARLMDNFFCTLLEAGINPLVVLDGVIVDDKTGTIANRTTRKVESIVRLLKTPDNEALSTSNEITTQDPEKQLKFTRRREPIEAFLLSDVIINSVKRVLGEDHLFVADCDGDVDIACLAIHHQCPVLSSDSDFYVFPLLYGYIPYTRFHWRNARSAKIRPALAINAEVYFYQLFCKQFGIDDPSLLTVLPTIVGNNAITKLDVTYLHMIMANDDDDKLVENAVEYIASFPTLYDCLTSLRKQKLFGMIESIQEAFHEYFFLPLFKPRNSLVTNVVCKDGSPLPRSILKRCRKGDFLPFVIGILWIHEAHFSVAMEDMLSEKWCCLIGVPIRRAIYGILCGNNAYILESQRCECKTVYSDVKIQCITEIMYEGKQISLPTLQSCGSEVETEYGKKILFGILEARERDLVSVPQGYQLLLAITHFWYKYCTINKKIILLESFLLLVQLFKEHKIERCLSVGSSTISSKSLFPIASFTHAFAQWQSLYHDVHCLNQLLQVPLKLLPVSDFLECSCLYSLVEVVRRDGILKAIEHYCLDRNSYQIFFAATNPAGELFEKREQ